MKDYGKYFDKNDDPKSGKFRKTNYRTLLKKDNILPDNAVSGLVYTSIGRIFHVRADSGGELFECSRAGTINSENENSSVVAVGDKVFFTRDKKNKSGQIVKVCRRQTWLSRKEPLLPKEQIIAANTDKLLIFMSAAEPVYNKRLIDRFLVAAEFGEIEPAICINKIDLVSSPKLKKDLSVYVGLGIKLFLISALTGRGIKLLLSYLKDSVTVLSGPSGAGKSTFINYVFGYEIQPIGEVSEKTSKGIHTTSYNRMFDLPKGGKIIDTPGIREFAVWGVMKEELPLYFFDLMKYQPDCRFSPCSHIHEPGCAVIRAVETGELDFDRYESYINLYNSF